MKEKENQSCFLKLTCPRTCQVSCTTDIDGIKQIATHCNTKQTEQHM